MKHLLLTLGLFLTMEVKAADLKILVLYHSPTGDTLKLAQEIAAGVTAHSSAKATLKSITDISPKDLASYDGIAFGSPVYFGSMSGEMKTFLDKTLELWKDKKLTGMPATVFLTAGSGAGKDLAMMNIWSTLASHGMLLIPIGPDGGSTPMGVITTATSNFEEMSKLARKQGLTLAQIAAKLKGQEVISLPTAPNPVGNYRPYKISGKLVYINQIALDQGKVKHPGIIGKNVSMEEAKEATRQTTLNVLAVLKSAVNGDLSKVKQAVQITGYFNTAPDFKDHSLLLNESSDLLIKVLGERGIHARAAMGAPSLPMESPTEIQAIFELK